MKPRSISDFEISLIKAMINRGMKNKDIQFFFNRPDRSVNSGRISGIRSGDYSNSSEIPNASKTELDNFLSKFVETDVSASVTVPLVGVLEDEQDPISDIRLRSMFKKDSTGVWRFAHGESDCHECKESFGFKYSDKWLRAVASLANNKGGYVIFGVKDKTVNDGKISDDSYEVVGLKSKEFENADPVEFTNRLKAAFDPTPLVLPVTIDLDGVSVGIFYVSQHLSRPIIALKNEGNQVRESDIYFRYPGQSARIKYSDLRAILDERDRLSREQIIPMVQKLLSLGPRNAMIADLSSGALEDGERSFVIDKDLVDAIKFIKKGEFDETKGDRTLRLIGDVQAVDSQGKTILKEFVTSSDVINDFLDQKSPDSPKEYIRCAVEVGNGAWLPLLYFQKKAAMSSAELSSYILATAASKDRKRMYSDRASGKISSFRNATGDALQILNMLKSGTLPKIDSSIDSTNFARAVAGLDYKPKIPLEKLLNCLKKCKKIVLDADELSRMSAIRLAVARLDFLYFR